MSGPRPLAYGLAEAEPRARGYALKRPFDFVLALLLAPFVLVVLLILGVLVRASSPGPVLFRQTRIGRDGRPFVCRKLRTMYPGTNNAPTHEVERSAITPLGGFLRHSKLDELPQLWNIIVGEMSFVGPRPCLPAQQALIEARRKTGVDGLLPGITGVAQIAGVDMREPVRLATLDATYLATMSIATDLRIMARTLLGSGRGDRVAEGS